MLLTQGDYYLVGYSVEVGRLERCGSGREQKKTSLAIG